MTSIATLPDRAAARKALQRIAHRKKLRGYAAEKKRIVADLRKLPIAKLREIHKACTA